MYTKILSEGPLTLSPSCGGVVLGLGASRQPFLNDPRLRRLSPSGGDVTRHNPAATGNKKGCPRPGCAKVPRRRLVAPFALTSSSQCSPCLAASPRSCHARRARPCDGADSEDGVRRRGLFHLITMTNSWLPSRVDAAPGHAVCRQLTATPGAFPGYCDTRT